LLISIDELKEYKEFQNIPDKTLELKLKAIEIAIRQITHNNFQNRLKRICVPSNNNILIGTSPYFKVGDTIEISENVNKGLYTIKAITDDYIELDGEIFDEVRNLCTKIEYPADIVAGAIELLKYEFSDVKSKTGIASESLSRHSVTYEKLDNSNTLYGYPTALFGFCSKYVKARF
jgi:hypothetical protein